MVIKVVWHSEYVFCIVLTLTCFSSLRFDIVSYLLDNCIYILWTRHETIELTNICIKVYSNLSVKHADFIHAVGKTCVLCDFVNLLKKVIEETRHVHSVNYLCLTKLDVVYLKLQCFSVLVIIHVHLRLIYI